MVLNLTVKVDVVLILQKNILNFGKNVICRLKSI